MKRVILVAAVSMMALASCKKDYTCECVTSGLTSGTTSTVIENSSKSDAEDACIKTTSVDLGGGQSMTTTCDLK